RLAQIGGSSEDQARARTLVDEAGRELARRAAVLLGTSEVLEPRGEDMVGGLGEKDALVAWRRVKLSELDRGSPLRLREVDSLVAFVLRPGPARGSTEASAPAAVLALFDLGPYQDIGRAVSDWRETLGVVQEGRGLGRVKAEPGSLPEVDAGQRLRELVLDPLRGALEGADRLVLALDA